MKRTKTFSLALVAACVILAVIVGIGAKRERARIRERKTEMTEESREIDEALKDMPVRDEDVEEEVTEEITDETIVDRDE
jgi:hypothetical protein